MADTLQTMFQYIFHKVIYILIEIYLSFFQRVQWAVS